MSAVSLSARRLHTLSGADSQRTICVIMGGGRGNRMYPLTLYRSKPAVPIGGKYRLIDVPISNCLNSGFNKILVLTQYNSQSLNNHISRTYRSDTLMKGYVEILAAEQSYERTDWYQGTADSVRRSLAHINDPHIDEAAVLSGDQLYTMDLRLLRETHRMMDADITVACHPVPAGDVQRFGIMSIDENDRIVSFVEKPADASSLVSAGAGPDGRPQYLASMGIYIFKYPVLKELLTSCDKTDFGKEIIPEAIHRKKVHAYVFDDYWSDIGTIRSYYEACLMLLEPESPFNLYNEEWQIYTRARHLPPAKMLRCELERSVVCEGSVIEDAVIRRSVIGVRSLIGSGSRVEESILNGNDYYETGRLEAERRHRGLAPVGVGRDCLIRRAIVDKNARIGDRVQIVNSDNRETADGKGYSIRDGIVVVHKGASIPDDSVI